MRLEYFNNYSRRLYLPHELLKARLLDLLECILKTFNNEVFLSTKLGLFMMLAEKVVDELLQPKLKKKSNDDHELLVVTTCSAIAELDGCGPLPRATTPSLLLMALSMALGRSSISPFSSM
jgi:hypothetical protein